MTADNVVEIDAFKFTAVLDSIFTACGFDQNSPHGLSRGGEEVAAAVPVLRAGAIDQAQVGFMHQRGGLQSLPWLLGAIFCAASLRNSA